MRVGSVDNSHAPSYDAVLKALLAVGESEEAMTAFVYANRDLLDYRFLYRLTSQKLRAINLGDSEKAQRLEIASTRAVKVAQRFDAPLFKQVGEAEARLGNLLASYMQGKPPKAQAVVALAGDSALATFAFWMVLIAASMCHANACIHVIMQPSATQPCCVPCTLDESTLVMP